MSVCTLIVIITTIYCLLRKLEKLSKDFTLLQEQNKKSEAMIEELQLASPLSSPKRHLSSTLSPMITTSNPSPYSQTSPRRKVSNRQEENVVDRGGGGGSLSHTTLITVLIILLGMSLRGGLNNWICLQYTEPPASSIHIDGMAGGSLVSSSIIVTIAIFCLVIARGGV